MPNTTFRRDSSTKRSQRPIQALAFAFFRLPQQSVSGVLVDSVVTGRL